MIYLLAFYWIVAGFAFFALPDHSGYTDRHPNKMLAACLVFGGIMIPARLLAKVLK